MPTVLRVLFASIATILALCAGAAQAAPRDGLEVRLSVAQPVLRGDVDIVISVAVTNLARHPIHLLRWQLPGDEVEAPLFRITRDGQPVAYTGPLLKRARPTAADHVRLDAGATLSYEVELTQAYELARNGRYAVQYLGRGGHGQGTPVLESDTLYLWLEGRSEKAPAPAAPQPAAASITYTGNCSASQKGTLDTAVGNATAYAGSAASYLNGLGGALPRYTTWFGTYSPAGRATALDHFQKTHAAFSSQALVLDCKCKKPSVYAYVYASQPYKIYLCGAFWNAPATGTDSKAGTLIHEMTHFTVVAGTNDYAYGQTSAKALASSSPAQALDNADNHEYFAENTPSLP